jgi:predicted Rossmann fold nucleotide-binding protein DprA/Smf involved in DNA uptake
MKEFDVALKAVAEGLKTIAQGMEKIAEKLEDSVPKGKAKAKPARKAAAKPKKAPAKKTSTKKAVKTKKQPATAANAVLAIINRSKKGVNSATLAKKTGFDNKKIANIVFKLRKQGKVKSVGRGVYTMA